VIVRCESRTNIVNVHQIDAHPRSGQVERLLVSTRNFFCGFLPSFLPLGRDPRAIVFPGLGACAKSDFYNLAQPIVVIDGHT